MNPISPIALISTPYKEKFAIPRQPNLVSDVLGELHFCAGFDDANMLRGIEQFSHLWLIFSFHATASQGWSPTVRPPRLGGNEKVGVFATRSTFRPNGLGLSVVKNEGIVKQQGKTVLRVSGMDLLDGTPIIDIKPYVPYADSIADASGGFAPDAPKQLPVSFSSAATTQINRVQKTYPQLQQVIAAVLSQDPRPAYKKGQVDDKVYGVALYDFNIRWRVGANGIEVLEIEKA